MECTYSAMQCTLQLHCSLCSVPAASAAHTLLTHCRLQCTLCLHCIYTACTLQLLSLTGMAAFLYTAHTLIPAIKDHLMTASKWQCTCSVRAAYTAATLQLYCLYTPLRSGLALQHCIHSRIHTFAFPKKHPWFTSLKRWLMSNDCYIDTSSVFKPYAVSFGNGDRKGRFIFQPSWLFCHTFALLILTLIHGYKKTYKFAGGGVRADPKNKAVLFNSVWQSPRGW